MVGMGHVWSILPYFDNVITRSRASTRAVVASQTTPKKSVAEQRLSFRHGPGLPSRCALLSIRTNTSVPCTRLFPNAAIRQPFQSPGTSQKDVLAYLRPRPALASQSGKQLLEI